MTKRAPFYMGFPDDEIIFSLVARYAILGAFNTRGLAVRDIFNNRKKRIHPYLPGYLTNVADFFELPPQKLLIKQTLYSLFSIFNPSKASKLNAAMLFNSDDKVTFIAGGPHSKYRFFHGIKYCPKCVEEDIKNWGFPYWHIKHQIPCVDSCYKHDYLLFGIQTGEGGKDRNLILPPENSSKCLANYPQIMMAKFSSDLLDVSRTQPFDYKVAYKNGLRDKGFITANEHIRLNQLVEQIKSYWAKLPFDSSLSVPKELSDYKFIGPMLRNSSLSPCHPVKHLLLACWLFDGNAGDLAAYSNIKNGDKGVVAPQKTEEQSNDAVLALLNEKLSMNRIEQRTGKSRCFIRRVAELNNVEHETNANSYSRLIREKVINLALLGRHRAYIAKLCHVGLGYVEQVISNTRGLVLWSKMLREKIKVNEAKKKLKTVISEHPDWMRKDIKKACSREFFCLYHHDRKSLERLLPVKTHPILNEKNWDEEDVRMAYAMKTLGGIENMSLSQIDRLVTGHGRFKKRLDKFPKSKQILRRIGKLPK